MKRHIKTLLIICITLVVFLIAHDPIPANAAEPDSYSLEIHLSMIQREDNTENLEDSMGCSFLMMNSDFQFLTADYEKNRNTYVITGYTNTPEQAAIFQVSPDNPSTIKIENLSVGQYSLQENSLTPGYLSFVDGVPIEISNQMALVNGDELPIENKHISFAITYYTPMTFPNLYSKNMILRDTLTGTLLILFSGVLLIFLIRKIKKDNLSEKP